MTPLRWGLLSTATINDALLGAGNAEVVAVASRDGARARAYADARGIEKAYGSYEALLADPEVDIVYVSLPNAMHLPWATKALRAGKHVLCEKPLSRRAADVEAAFALADELGLVLAEGFMWRHHPQLAEAQRLIAEGAIGRLRLIRADFAFTLPDAVAEPRLLRDLGGGALMDVGCYCVSGARALAGAEPVAVSAQQITGGDGVDLVLTALLRFPGDVLATFDCAFVGPERDHLMAIGDAGSLLLPDPWHAREPVIELTRDGRAERIALDPTNHYALQVADVEAAVRGERAPLLGRADAVGQARAIEALYAAADADAHADG
jgi:predicted dehydrogenase